MIGIKHTHTQWLVAASVNLQARLCLRIALTALEMWTVKQTESPSYTIQSNFNHNQYFINSHIYQENNICKQNQANDRVLRNKTKIDPSVNKSTMSSTESDAMSLLTLATYFTRGIRDNL